MLDAELMFICLWLLAVTQMVLLYEANARLLFLSLEFPCPHCAISHFGHVDATSVGFFFVAVYALSYQFGV